MSSASGEFVGEDVINEPSGPIWAARPFLLFLAAAAAWLIGGEPESGSWIWVLALGVVGMPHGAYDLSALRRISADWRQTLIRFGWYTLVMIASTMLILAAPWASVVGFLLLASHHFGVSDAVWTRGLRSPSAFGHLVGSGHGLIVIMAPFLFMPNAAWWPFGQIVSWISGQAAPSAEPMGLLAVVMLPLGLSVVLIATLVRPQRLTDMAEEWGTLLGMITLSSVAPPLVSIGAYFMLVHASGHCLRAQQPGFTTRQPGLANAVRVHVESAPLLVVSILMVLGVAMMWRGPIPQTIACSFILFCMVATLPHHLLWMGWFSSQGGTRSSSISGNQTG